MFFNTINSLGFLITKQTSGFPLPVGMFSTVLKNPLYSGPIFNVRRSSDNTTIDVYSDEFGNYTVTGGSTYSSWIGANIGYVTIWYNQNGSIHMYQTTTTTGYQPQLLASSYDLSFNGSSTHLYSGSGTAGSYTASFNPANLSIATCCTFRTSNSNSAVVSSRNVFFGYTFYRYDNNTFSYQLGNGGSSWMNASSSSTFTINTQYKSVLQCPQTGPKTVTVNGTTNSVAAFNYSPNTTYVTRIGAGQTENTTPNFYFAGTMKDVFIYNTVISDSHRNQLITKTLG